MKVNVKNYKIFKQNEVQLKDYNLIVGKNSTGKTTLLEIIKLCDSKFENKELYIEELEIRGKRFEDINNIDNIDNEDIIININDDVNITLSAIRGTDHKVKYEKKGKIGKVSYFKSNRIISNEQIVDSTNEFILEEDSRNLAHLIKENKIEKEIYGEVIDIFSFDENIHGMKILNISDILYTPRYDILFNDDSIDNQGFGVKYILPLLVQVKLLENSILIIENPEIYLHPNAQSKLINVLIKNSELRGNKLIIESHSDHIINSFRNNMVLENKDAGIFFIEKTNNEVKEITITEDKKYSDFPEGFLDQNIKDLQALYD